MLLRGMGARVSFLSLLFLVGAVYGIRDGSKNHRNNRSRALKHARERVCIGTNSRWSVSSNREHHFRNLKSRFGNCTYVEGNLELTWIQDVNADLSFLKFIREVTGYVLIANVDVNRVVLPRLQIIRGKSLLKMASYKNDFSLIVATSKMFSLELPALRDVLSGSIGFFGNNKLCHVKTINWKEIISDDNERYVYDNNSVSPERECSCYKHCIAGCWGEGKKNCQKFSKENCSPQCYQGRCFGPNPRECCHLFCAGGCTGPKQSDCIACKKFFDDGVCTQECPPMQIYNQVTSSWEPNPRKKYAYGATCVKNCPKHLLTDNGACITTCPPDKTAVNSECVPCNGPCPKTCKADGQINSGNIDSFKGCTVIEGYIRILESSFTGYQHFYPNFTIGPRYLAMHPDRLEVFSTLKKITGYLDIQAEHPEFKNLTYFRNLKVIGGRIPNDYFKSLYIVNTSLESLGLNSLKKINSGIIAIIGNRHLCFAENIAWKKVCKNIEFQPAVYDNRNALQCKEAGLVCDPQCTKDGCWGPGSDQCLACSNYRLQNTCLQNCSSISGVYRASTGVCKRCHEQCAFPCNGPGPANCSSCKHLKEGRFCISQCSATKYEESGECRQCHGNCVEGCTGPLNIIGKGGCNSCEKAIIHENANTTCLHKDEPCPDGYFYDWIETPQEKENLKPLAGKAICRRCHPRCTKCTGYGFHELVCQQCTHYKKGEQCEDECSTDSYADEEQEKCFPCDEECEGCNGPGPDNCLSCKHFKVYLDEGATRSNATFQCASNCPPELPYIIYSKNNTDTDSYCSSEPMLSAKEASNNSSLYGSIVGGVLLLCCMLGVLIYYYCKHLKVQEEAMKITRTLTGLQDDIPLILTNVPPNLAKLRIIKEAEMSKGGILGYGAFGTVYKGFWVPEGENSKIPVAIKLLREDSGANTSKEFLDEAYIMATVDHPNVLQLLAVCMTSQMMLITPLMPLGCLLDFVRTNRERIGSKLLLNWCTQIAKGMAYLKEKRLVHRDLAARNVLVQTLLCVKITDFGLSKLLDTNAEEYKADGGKWPIKWLALECIQHRIFTHKSDVWAFGVTVWELLTFGERPYDNVDPHDVSELLQKGERLPQPAICTIEVYMIMLKCWMLDAERRPGFKELTEDFAKMTMDPGRYLVIAGDVLRRPQNFTHQDDKDMTSTLENTGSHSGEEPHYKTPISVTDQHNRNQERIRHAKAHGLDPSSVCMGNTSRPPAPQISTLKLELPSDEDDYLKPSPQGQGYTTYVDIIGESKICDSRCDAMYRSYPDFCKTNIDNLEYLIGNETPPCQTLGMATVSEYVHPNSINTNKNPFHLLDELSEEESDHEYNIDVNRLRRELQPLPLLGKGVTTL